MSTSPIHLFFDGDDTLWDNASNYLRAHHDFLDLCEELGFERRRAEECLIAKDRELIRRNRFGHRWYKMALVETYRELVKDRIELSVLDSISRVIRSNFQGRVSLHEGAADLLDSLKAPHRRLKLFTVGNSKIQARKIILTRILHYLEEAVIGSSKTMEDYRALLEYYRIPAEQAVMFGDSFYRDVQPALQAGMTAVLIRNAHTWEYENLNEETTSEITVLDSLQSIPNFLNENGF